MIDANIRRYLIIEQIESCRQRTVSNPLPDSPLIGYFSFSVSQKHLLL